MNQDSLQEELHSQREEIIKLIIEAINKMPNREIDLIFRFVKDIY